MAETEEPRKVPPWSSREQDRAWAPPPVAPEAAQAPPVEKAIRPPWPTSTLPAWLGGSLIGFGVLMLVLYPWAVLTPNGSGHWAIYFIAIVGSLIVGVSSTRRTRRKVLSADEHGYTMRVDYVRPKEVGTPLVKPPATRASQAEGAGGSEIVLPGGTRVVSPPPPGWASPPSRKPD
jgi:hypothetical protein